MSEPAPQTAVTTVPQIEVYQDAERVAAARHPWTWSIRIDGQETCYWCPTEHAAKRVITRLNLGRSGEAFGGSGIAQVAGAAPVLAVAKGRNKVGRGKIVTAGEVTTELVTMKSGRQKPREKRPAFIFELDGRAREDLKFVDKDVATARCAIEAFRTRGKLNPGRHAEAQAAFREQMKKDCKVHQVGRRVVAKDSDGLLWIVSFEQDGGFRFKMLGQA